MAQTLSADEAAHRLGIRKATLYTYASRGLLRSVKVGRTCRYLESEVDSLRVRAASVSGHEAAAASALDWGAPVLESRITTIGARGPVYRGHVAVALADAEVSFERVFDLLVEGTLPAVSEFPSCPAGPSVARVPGDTVFTRLMGLVVQLVADDELRLAVSGEVERQRRRALVRRMIAGCLGPPSDAALTEPTLGGALAVALGLEPTLGRWVSRALVVCADHELNASTFAARVAAGTGADTGACVVAALAALSGPRHGGATDRAERLLSPVVDPATARIALREALSSAEVLPGFGHRLYPAGDPRAVALLRWSEDLDPVATAPIRSFAALVADTTGELPTLDVGLVAFARALRLPPGTASTLFALGRTAGWIAHVEEQRKSGRMLRPRAATAVVGRRTR